MRRTARASAPILRPSRPGWEPKRILASVRLDGPIAETLAEYVAANEIDIVVMTTHGRGGLAGIWLGSVAYEFAHRITVPLLLARPTDTAPDLMSRRMLQRFLLPLDGSPLAEQML